MLLNRPLTAARSIKHRGLVVLAVLGLLIAGSGAVSMIAGYGLNLRSFARAVFNVVQAISHHQATAQPSNYHNIVFLHHSVGANLINEGDLRELLAQAGYSLWDHDYNSIGLRDPAGQFIGYSYNVPADNTDPDGLAAVFEQPVYDWPVNTLSALLQHEVIVIKSCFSASDVQSDGEMQTHQQMYLKIRAVIDQHPDKFFIIVTPPPLTPAETRPDDAARARVVADWLKSGEFLNGHPNLVTYDLFGSLIDDQPQSPDYNMLRAVYRTADSHPNSLASQTIAPQFAAFITNTVARFRAAN